MKAAKHYTWLYLDLDNTILDFDKASWFAFYDAFDKHMVEMDRAKYKRYKEINHKMWVELEKGNMEPDVLVVKRWELFMDELGLKLDPEIINNSYFDHLGYNPIYVPGAKELIPELSNLYNLCLVTNGLAQVQIPRLRLTGIDKYFKHIVISETIGVAKPAEAFFDHVQNLTEHPMKEDVLVVGDTLTSDIRGGINYGFDTCWFDFRGEGNATEYHPQYTISSLEQLRGLLVEE